MCESLHLTIFFPFSDYSTTVSTLPVVIRNKQFVFGLGNMAKDVSIFVNNSRDLLLGLMNNRIYYR